MGSDEESQLPFDHVQNDDDRQSNSSTKSEEDQEQGGEQDQKVGLRERIKHFTWAWYTGTMSTGGIAILLAETPHRFKGLYALGVIVFIFHLTSFLLLSTLMCIRACVAPRHFLKSLTNPKECFFVPAFWLSIATILGCIQEYGVRMGPEGTWLITTLRVLFWMYAGTTVVSSFLQYWAFMNFSPTNVFEMNPAWFLPAYAIMLTGTVASLIASSQPPEQRMPIIVAGIAYQGFGFLTSYLFLVIYFARLIQSGLPGRDLRPSLFFPVGSIGYTIVALMGLAKAIPRDYGYFAEHPSSPEVLSIMALWASIFLWLFGFFLFSLGLLGCVEYIPKMGFTLSWWAFVFPNVGFTLATIAIGRQLKSEGILWVTSVATILLVAVWLFLVVAVIRAVWIRRIMWPGQDEDKDV